MLPAGSTVELAGESREFRESGSALYFAFALALIFVFMVLAAQFESLLHPFTVLLAVPLAVTGALAALWLAGSTLNVYSQVGMILLIGLVSKNSILLVTYANDLRAQGHDALVGDARGGAHPSAPDSHDVGRGDLRRAADRARPWRRRRQPPPARLRDHRRPVVSTLLTLYLVPAVFVVFERRARSSRGCVGARRRSAAREPDGCFPGGTVRANPWSVAVLATFTVASAVAIPSRSDRSGDGESRTRRDARGSATARRRRSIRDAVAARSQVETAAWERRAAVTRHDHAKR